MPTTGPAQPGRSAPEDDLFDYALIRDHARLLLGAPSRHRKLAAGVFLAVLSVTLLALFTLPRAYTAECRILARGSNRHWYLPGDETPTRAASELILSQGSLESLVRETDLLGMAERSRTRRLRDFLIGWLSKPSEEDRREALTETLEKRIKVGVSGEGVIAISATWQDPVTAYRLVEAAQRNFLLGKEISESAAILETIVILETHLGTTRAEVDQQLEQLRGSLARASHTPAARPAPRAPPVARPSEKNDALLAERRKELKNREEARDLALTAFRAELARLRTLYTDNHPFVLDALQRLAQAEAMPVDLALLRDEVAALEKQAGAAAEPSALTAARPLSLPREATLPNNTGDPEVEYESAQLRLLVLKYNNLLDRLDSAHIDLETTRAAFKERFKVLRPPQVPVRADNMKPPVIVTAGVAVALLLALLVAALVDVWAGPIVLRWQIQRQLGVPLLGEIGRLP